MEFAKRTVNNDSPSSSLRHNSHEFEEIDNDLRTGIEWDKPMCKYGDKCYQKNRKHLAKYRHVNGHDEQSKSHVKTPLTKSVKITDFFTKTPQSSSKVCDAIPQKMTLKDESDYEIEDSSSDDGKQKKNLNKPKIKPHVNEECQKGKRVESESVSRNKIVNNEIHYFQSDNSDDDNSKLEIPDSQTKIFKINDDKSNETKEKSAPIGAKRSAIDSYFTPQSKAKTVKYDNCKEMGNDPIESSPLRNTKGESSNINKSRISESPKPKLSPEQLNDVIKEIFLFEMPKDFFYLWHLAKDLKPERPQDAFLDTLGLTLVGPYDILTGKVKKCYIKDNESILCHWRYYYDTPELQTVIKGNCGYHIGYFRDDPNEQNPIVVSNYDDKCMITPIADNILAVIFSEIQKRKTKSNETINKTLTHVEQRLKKLCMRFNVKYNDATQKIRLRKAKVNSKTFNDIGIVVPVRNDVGYRPLTESDANLKKILNRICMADAEDRQKTNAYGELRHIISCVNYANDECDFGMGLELGIDLFSYGDAYFHSIIKHLLTTAYGLLNRQTFARIIEAHLNNRRKTVDLDAVN